MRKRPFFNKIVVSHNAETCTFPEVQETMINVGSREHPKKLIPIYGGYDVETTTVHTGQGHRSAVWSHAFTLANKHTLHIYAFRRWDEFFRFLERMREFYHIDTETRIILWVANLSFEFSFLELRFVWDEVFAKDTRQPLLASANGLEFRECLTISGGSLATLAKDYCYTQKMVGDLDYKALRNYDTPVTKQEELYIYNDVIILAEYSRYLFQNIIRKKRYVPMTRTGIVLRNIKDRLRSLTKSLCCGTLYHDFIVKNFPDKDLYNYWFKFLFRGGYVHGNGLYCNVDLPDVRMKDITSSYPYTMLADYVPRGAFRKVSFDSKYLKSHCCIIYARFVNISQTTHHTIESSNKVISETGGKWDNGRLIAADELCVCLTELDLDTYRHFYKWDRCYITDFYISERSTLPKFHIDNLLDAYRTKCQLKRDGKDETPEYHISKSDVNTHYGGCVKRIRLDTITFDPDLLWDKKENDKDWSEEVSKAILLPQWGIWITAHARHNLLHQVWKLTKAGVTVIYCDTDSIKYREHPAAERIFKRYNQRAARKLRHRGYTDDLIRGLGEFSDETKGQKVRFKTLGAKRYIYFDIYKGEIKATVAGMPKSSIQSLGETVDEIFDIFSDNGFKLTVEQSGKLRPEYTDEHYSLYVNGQWMEEESGCALVEQPFTVTLKDEYYAYIHQIQDLMRIGDTA